METKAIVFVSEVASLCGQNEHLCPQADAIKSVHNRSLATRRNPQTHERLVGNILLRGQVSFQINCEKPKPCLYRTRQKPTGKLWNNDYLQCYALSFLAHADGTFFIEVQKDTNQTTLTQWVPWNESAWQDAVNSMHEALCLPSPFTVTPSTHFFPPPVPTSASSVPLDVTHVMSDFQAEEARPAKKRSRVEYAKLLMMRTSSSHFKS